MGELATLLPWQTDLWEKIHLLRNEKKLPHAFLFLGQQGIGKLQFAKTLAQSFLCTNRNADETACGECHHCHLFKAGNNPSLKEIKPEDKGKQIKIDVIRALVEKMVLATNEDSFNIVIIHPADAMNTASANALLKTLEEPVDRTIIILISDSPHLLLPTIKSRCRTLRFTPPDEKMAVEWLLTQNPPNKEVLSVLKENAMSPLTTLLAIENDWNSEIEPFFNDFMTLTQGKADVVSIAQKWSAYSSAPLLIERLMSWVMDIVRLKLSAQPPLLYNLGKVENLQTLAERLDLTSIQLFLSKLYDYKQQLTSNLNQQLAMENLLIEWVKISTRN